MGKASTHSLSPSFPCLSKILFRPSQPFDRIAGGPVFAADPALITKLVDVLEQERIVDLAGARLMAPRGIGKLHVTDLGEMLFDGGREIAFLDLHVIDVVL